MPARADPPSHERPASLWRDTLGNVFRQTLAVIGLSILTSWS